MTDTSASRPPFVLKGWHVLIAFVAFFAIDIAVNVNFIMSAYRTFPGETEATPYEDGIKYNQALAQKRAQALLGWRFTAGAGQGGGLRVDAFDRTGAPLHGLTVTAHLRRPATETGERNVALAETAPGTYSASGFTLNGAWDVELTAHGAHGEVASFDRRLVAP
jgi:nitrogen fixation protein FixH